MPTYEFECPSCGNREDRFLPVSQRNRKQDCGCGAKLDRLISCPQMLIRGEGIESMGYRQDDLPFAPGGDDKAYEERCAKRIADEREKRRVVKRSLKNTKQREHQWEKIAVIPTELHQAEITRTRNPMVWHDEGEALMKRTGTWIDD